mmetsp:Transcript_31396/g.55232  ORF Transcript_31396/g.55232 Transcript_31396/m.55232 type:complete len:667 (-) Transcript_31396:188-2188(-)|eukprot:CAMPEP_0197517724 /NCGR_PEP_ID=MMETSP1318-20131121/2786_1 /TAXON_ID=552666 /ORGANISM="Partenskyella glossopodia, Strain RCC365" /LENGTH=666 /DNA_ID=CAMNT_0043067525 /DNA_START=97 /DNA_END=2097 /DNA_ORIENTATION=-
MDAKIDPKLYGDIAEGMRKTIEVKDRKYHLQTYSKCFLGTDAIKYLMKEGFAETVEDAEMLGEALVKAGEIRHVCGEHMLKNKALFYRFKQDSPFHGAKSPRGAKSAPQTWTTVFQGLGRDWGHHTGHQPSIVSSLSEGDVNPAVQEQLKKLLKLEVSPLDKYNTELLENVHPLEWVDPEPQGKYNLVVIGAGAAGLVTSAGAAGVGAKVALIESDLLGGDCLNVGCVPSKALLKSAKIAHQIKKAKDYGIMVGEAKVDFTKIMERLRRLRAGIAHHDSAERFASLGVDVYLGHGKFISKNQVEVNGKTLTFHRAVIATGGSPNIPDIPGLRNVPLYTNLQVFNLTKLPKVIGVIGTGPIGCELAQAFARFGAEVHMFLRGTSILRKEEEEAREVVMEAMVDDGIVFHKNIKYHLVEKVEDADEKKDKPFPSIRIDISQEGKKKSVVVNAIIVAAGRKPNVTGADLEKAGVKYDPKKGVLISETLQTSNPNVFAVGDCAHKYQFTHMADFMARMVIRNSLFFGSGKVSSLLVPWATYTDPEVAHVGEYDHDLKSRNVDFDTYTRYFKDVDRAIVDSDTRGYVKILTMKGKDKILGATIVGSNAGSMISEITLAMQSNVGLGKIAAVIHPYPTAAEAIRQCGDAYNRTRLSMGVKKTLRNLLAFRRS